MASKAPCCKGCGSTTRVLAYPGPRCSTCWRAEKKRRSKAAKEKRVEKVYGISAEEYDAILAFQSGRCAVCQVATGRTKRLAVDHDHAHCGVCAGPQTCGAPEAIRCLACGPCNQDILSRPLAALGRAARVLTRPDAPAIIRHVRGNR